MDENSVNLIGPDPTLVKSRVCAPESFLKAARESFPVGTFDYCDGAKGYELKYPRGEHKLGQMTDYFAKIWGHHT
jgi:hypothetical protein